MADNDNEQQISLETMSDVAKNLAELLTNSVNMTDVYYEIFFDPNPHYVELKRYDSNGNLITVLVPNRAMDRSIAFYGDIDPENEVEGYLGALYINVVSRNLFIKKTPEGKLGWTNLTPQKVEYHRETYPVNSMTTYQQITFAVPSKDYIDVYVNGVHLEESDYELGSDFKTLNFTRQFADYSTMQIVYQTGLYGLKGDTALTLEVHDTYTVAPDQEAKVVNVGDGENIKLDFYIPQGIKGQSGVYVGEETEEKPAEDDNVWIDPTGTGYTSDDLSVSRIFDSGNNTNPIAYKKAYELMHSTVDTDKFTILGSISIDDYNIMTVHENNAGIQTPIKVKHLLENQNWSISGRDYLNVNESDGIQYFYTLGHAPISPARQYFYFNALNHQFVLAENDLNDTRTELWVNDDIYTSYHNTDGSTGGWFNWKVEYSEGSYKVYISFEDEALKMRGIFDRSVMPVPEESYLYIKADTDDNYSHHKSDLGYFEVRSNNVVIFTPNKTEYVKVVNETFHKVGNPVINEEGILINVEDASDFIYADYTAGTLANKDWSINGHFKNLGNTEVLFQFADPEYIETVSIEENVNAGDYTMLSAVNTDNKIVFHLYTGTVDAHSIHVSKDFELEENTDYYYSYIHNYHTHKYTFKVSDNAEMLNSREYTYTANSSNKDPFVVNVHPNYKLVLGSSNTAGTGTKTVYNNLNYFTIYNRNKLVYSPLFRIPCVIASSGAKFAYSYSRELVERAYVVYDKGDMFVIDEINRSITLPLDDVYSLIGREHENQFKIGKGLILDERTNTVNNLVEGNEIGDIGESVKVDENLGVRRILNGQLIQITDDLKPFYNFVKSLSNTLRVSEAEWQAEAAQGDCNKFVISTVTNTDTVNYYAFIPEHFLIVTPILPDEEETESNYDGNAGYYLEGDNISIGEIVQAQEEAGYEEPVIITPDIEYVTSISEDLTESDIVYATSLDPLATGVTFRKVNNIVYPDNSVTVADLLNENYYVRYEDANFSAEVETETETYIRIPKLTSSRVGYQYYIQVANGVDNHVYLENTYNNITPYAYGMYQYADVDINCPGWLLSDGSWYPRSMYQTFYDWIKANAEGRNRAKWVQPIFKSNTYKAFGGAIYTVSASHVSNESQPYRVFNGSLGANNEWWTNHGVTSTENPCWWQMHSTVALVFKKITIMNENTSPQNFKTGYVQVSSDGTNWKNVCIMNGINSPETGDGNLGGLVPITIDWNNTIDSFTTEEINLGFNYLRLYFVESFSELGISIQLIDIDAEQTYLDKFKKANNPAYSVTEYDFVINEENETFRLPLLANACDYSKMRFLVDSQVSNTGNHRWFNLYSDGWLEQGGYITPGAVNANWSGYQTITFPKAYKDTAYNRLLGDSGINNGANGNGVEWSEIKVNSFRLRWYNCSGTETHWRTSGYTTPPAFDTYRHLFPRLYYYVGDTVQMRKEINMAELANEVASLKRRIEDLGG